jgi:hypothetical protein
VHSSFDFLTHWTKAATGLRKAATPKRASIHGGFSIALLPRMTPGCEAFWERPLRETVTTEPL